MKPITIIDVREKDEFQKEHIRHSIDVPLSFIENREERFAKLLHGKNILLMCRSGRRAQLAYDILKHHIPESDLKVYEGGFIKYAEEHPEEVIHGRFTVNIPIMRQVQLTVGLLIILFLSLATTVHLGFLFPVAFMALGLTYAGLSGNCTLALLLSKLPFNQ